MEEEEEKADERGLTVLGSYEISIERSKTLKKLQTDGENFQDDADFKLKTKIA